MTPPLDPLVFNALRAHAKFYPIRANKSPAISDLENEPSTDVDKLRFWQRRRSHAGFAARIRPESPLFVLDLESPSKHAGRVGPDGMVSLCGVLDDHDIMLPEAPTVRTPTDGRHIYLIAPDGVHVHPRNGIWPGVDVLAARRNVILPGAKLAGGEYWIERGFDFIPEAPELFVAVLGDEARPMRHCSAATLPAIENATAAVSPREWFLLRHSPQFWTMWRREKLFGDQTDSAYEFHLAKRCFCVGFNTDQVVTVLRYWWAEQGLRRRERKFRKAILPQAWAEVAEFVLGWKADRESRRQLPRGRHHSEATARVLAIVDEHPEWNTSALADAAGVTRRHAAMILLRRRRSDTRNCVTPEGETRREIYLASANPLPIGQGGKPLAPTTHPTGGNDTAICVTPLGRMSTRPLAHDVGVAGSRTAL